MGWFWGSSPSSPSDNSSDPLQKLDPALRDFLEKEAPAQRPQSASPRPSPPTSAPIERPHLPTVQPKSTPSTTSLSADPSTPAVPPQSLYQDGRYAHLWKGYRPQSEVESAGKSDQEKLTDIIDSYNERKAGIGRAALENCALEQLAYNECFRSGSWKSRMTMCKAENNALERCYSVQGRFLKALGYLSDAGRSEEDDERIQMHADRLYQRMLEQERQIEEAKKAGLPVPEFKPVLSGESMRQAMAGGSGSSLGETQTSSVAAAKNLPTPATPGRNQDVFGNVPEETRKNFEKRLESLSREDRELELRAIQAELNAGRQFGRQIESALEEQRQNRLKRKEHGQESMGDKIKSWWGW
ncbi:hypothetical protein W97_01707 [Coniosporium apollinis CBS 100218]|uniref:Autophagy-related protein 6 n=1 Tax=Coniosporium apollinis (strain CBS 100218) TaxID=1168221 RepID=R7YKR1_CONA1|nr:uncharacterized protein W97_01707 [Coniosporium apollinis CBS 100218]EON62485.1 hypothetical protein W97_01707 [Coniosporium apollinis CBS 100218]